MADFDWKAVVRTVAPGLATALGGPLAGMAVTALGNALGMDQATVETVSARLQGATPADLAAMKKAEQDFQVQMKTLEINFQTAEIKTAADDRKSAREREIAVKDWIPGVLAILLTCGFFGVLTWLLKYGTPKDGGSEAILVMLGALGAAFGAIVNYYYGSSSQGEKQQAVIGKIASSP